MTLPVELKNYRSLSPEGRYLLRSTLSADNPHRLWHLYIQLTEIEQVFKGATCSIRALSLGKDDSRCAGMVTRTCRSAVLLPPNQAIAMLDDLYADTRMLQNLGRRYCSTSYKLATATTVY